VSLGPLPSWAKEEEGDILPILLGVTEEEQVVGGILPILLGIMDAEDVVCASRFGYPLADEFLVP